jgi:hypothetical protein
MEFIAVVFLLFLSFLFLSCCEKKAMILFLLFLCFASSQVIPNYERLNVIGSYYFSVSEAALGDVVLIGAPSTGSRGVVYAYVCNGGYSDCFLAGQIAPLNLTSGDQFGNAIAMADTRVAVGSKGKSGDTGALYLFDCTVLSDCIQLILLNGQDYEGAELFGFSVALQSNYLVVGATGSDDNVGVVYVFDCPYSCTKEGFIVLVSPTGLSGGDFGYWVSITPSNQIITTAPLTSTGQAFIFTCYDATNCTTGFVIATPSGLVSDDQFGRAMSSYGEIVAIGAPNKNIVFMYDCAVPGCELISYINTPIPYYGISVDFGFSLSLFKNTLVIGAPSQSYYDGAAYLFDCTNPAACIFVNEISSPRRRQSYFGGPMAITDSIIVIGASNLNYWSSAYVFENSIIPTAAPSVANEYSPSFSLLVAFFLLLMWWRNFV